MLEHLLTLRATEPFGGLPDETLLTMIPLLRARHLDGGQAVVRQGEPGRSLFVLARGEVEVRVDGRTVSRLQPGAVFGELALLASEPRTATVEAVGDVLLLELEQDVFFAIMETEPDLIRGLARMLIDRSRTTA
jgi:CRP-like cAMP-binding protein